MRSQSSTVWEILEALLPKENSKVISIIKIIVIIPKRQKVNLRTMKSTRIGEMLL